MQARQYPPELPAILRVNAKPVNTKKHRTRLYVRSALNFVEHESGKKMTVDICQKYPLRADTCAQERNMQSEIMRTGHMCEQY